MTSQVTIDTETSSLIAREAELVICTMTTDAGTLLIHSNDKESMQFLNSIWDDPTVEKNFQNGSYDVTVLERILGKKVQGYAWDTLLAEHLLHEESHYALEVLRGTYTDQPVYERALRQYKEEPVLIPNGMQRKVIKERIPDGETKKHKPKFRIEKHEEFVPKFRKSTRGKEMHGYAEVPAPILEPYGVYDSQTEHMVWRAQERVLSDKKKELLKNVVIPYRLALTDMEREGILIDVARLPEIRRFYIERADALAAKVFESADMEFKLSSPPQVRQVLFQELRLPLPPIRSKKTGDVSTGKKSLDWLSSHADHPILQALEEWRAINHLITEFIGRDDEAKKGLMSHLTSEGRLHTSFRQTLETGRVASADPNLMNMPAESKGPIRELFIAAPGNVLVQADYSQIELRVAAYVSNEKTLIDLLENGGDVHTYFARRLYPDLGVGLSDAEWAKEFYAYRTLAKRFTFGRLFGQSEAGMALVFNISGEEAARFQRVYDEIFPGLKAWWDDIIATVRAGEALETIFGRTRYFPAYEKFANINWRGKFGMFGHMDREAMNFIPQGTAADVLGLATGNIRKLIQRFDLPMSLRLVVHDSLTVECPEWYTEKAKQILKFEMEDVGRTLGWYLPVECEAGHNWSKHD